MTLEERNQFAQHKFLEAIKSDDRWKAAHRPAGWPSKRPPGIAMIKLGDPVPGRSVLDGWQQAGLEDFEPAGREDHNRHHGANYHNIKLKTHAQRVGRTPFVLAPVPLFGRCKYPLGDPKEKDFRFCRKNRVPGLVYCREHYDLCHRPKVI